MYFLHWLRTALKSALLYLHTSTGSVQSYPFTFLRLVKHDYQNRNPLRFSWLLPMPSVIRSHSGNCVLRRSGRSLVNKRDALPLVSSSLSLYCAAFYTYRRIKGKPSDRQSPLTRLVYCLPSHTRLFMYSLIKYVLFVTNALNQSSCSTAHISANCAKLLI